MIPLPSVEDMEGIAQEARIQFYEFEELTEEQVNKLEESYKRAKEELLNETD